MKEKIVVIRKWKEPAVRTYMSPEAVGIEMDVEDYLTNLVEQLTNIPLTFTKSSLLIKMKEANANIVNEMKQTTKHVT